jgi:peptidoglycan hydrolase CwlO-like protein
MGVFNFDKKTTIITIVILLIAGVACWLMFSGGIPDTGSGIDAARTNLQSVGDQQQSAIDRLGDIETGLTDSANKAGTISTGLGDTAKSIDTVTGRIDQSEVRLKSSAELISEGQRILATVRERGQTGN